MKIFGRGLLTGLRVTGKSMSRRSVTAHYPDAKPKLPPRSRGVIALMQENCTSCMLCARECPCWCIYIDSHKEPVPPATPGGRERSTNMLDRFAIDFSLCMYCSICIEVCPFDALFWSPEFEYAEYDIRDLTHEKDRLQEWMWTAPPPDPLDPKAAEPKEVASARKAADRLVGSRPAPAAPSPVDAPPEPAAPPQAEPAMPGELAPSEPTPHEPEAPQAGPAGQPGAEAGSDQPGAEAGFLDQVFPPAVGADGANDADGADGAHGADSSGETP